MKEDILKSLKEDSHDSAKSMVFISTVFLFLIPVHGLLLPVNAHFLSWVSGNKEVDFLNLSVYNFMFSFLILALSFSWIIDKNYYFKKMTALIAENIFKKSSRKNKFLTFNLNEPFWNVNEFIFEECQEEMSIEKYSNHKVLLKTQNNQYKEFHLHDFIDYFDNVKRRS